MSLSTYLLQAAEFNTVLRSPFEHGGRDGDQQDDSNDDEGDETQREGLEGDGRRRVRLGERQRVRPFSTKLTRIGPVATDFVNLKPETFMDDSTSEDCALVLETRLARYLIGSPAKEYLNTFQDAPVLLNLLAWGSFCEVRPSTSTKDPLGDLRRNLNASLRSPREMDAYLFRAVNLEYHLDTPLSESLAFIKSDVLDLLQQWLPNPILCASIYSLGRPSLLITSQHHSIRLRGASTNMLLPSVRH